MPALVQFGAGNIGRSFIAPLFAAAGFTVTFVDVNTELIGLLNARGAYPVRILDDARPSELRVEGISAVHGTDREPVAERLAEADIAATAVGAGALPHLYAVIAQGLELRHARHGLRPLDMILAENLRHAAAVVREGVRSKLPTDFPLDAMLGLVETSIGKMAPLLTEEQRREDPLLVCAEPYNTLILDARAFLNPIPDVPGLYPTLHMAAYVDRKLFIHNLGHAAAAYLAFQHDPSLTYIWEAVAAPPVRAAVEAAMHESANALLAAYPDAFTAEALEAHIADLLHRFANRALGDTIYRVGRDLPRKMSRDDRVIGAMRLDQAHGLPYAATAAVAAAALAFRATDPAGQSSPPDQQMLDQLAVQGIAAVLPSLTSLDPASSADAELLGTIQAVYASNLTVNT